MALSAAETAELASLTDALVKLRSGQMPSRILYNGEQTDFAKVDIADLDARVRKLQAMQSSPCGRVRGGLRFRL